jgi:hypothetical protein
VPRRLLDYRGPDLDVALKLAAEGSKQCNRKVEVRPFLGVVDKYGDDRRE